MSKQRQATRAAREAAAAQRAARTSAARESAAAQRARRDRRRLLWSRLRLWQHGPSAHRQRESRGAMAIIVLLVLLVVFIVTRSVAAVIGTALVCVIALPVLAKVLFDRSRP